MALTILLSMVFVVSIGYTFAQPIYDYQKSVNMIGLVDNERVDRYLNDVVVNNSTKLIPIPYTVGTVNREISYDYSFSNETDIAVEYSMQYTDGTPVDNVRLNIVNRENYIVDVPVVSSKNENTLFDSSSANGTLYYLPTISAGTGNIKLISGVTFKSSNNKVSTYSAKSAITLYDTSYAVGDSFTYLQFEYTRLDIARYWKIYSYKNSTQTITPEEYTELSATEQSKYQIYQYICKQGYTSNGNTVSVGTICNTTQYENYLNANSALWDIKYLCTVSCTINDTSYVAGTSYISEAQYSALSVENKSNFDLRYVCKTAYSVVGANRKTVSAGQTITAEEYKELYILEQKNFMPYQFVSYENKELEITIKVHYLANVNETKHSATQYYSLNHKFADYAITENSVGLQNWLNYKKSPSSISNSTFMIYNEHANFESGIPYSLDFADKSEILANNVERKSNITTAYLYTKNADNKYYFSNYAGGNRYDAGIGLYYQVGTSGSFKVSIGVNWYNPNGEIVTSMPISNVNIVYSTSFENIEQNSYGYKALIPANSCGYINLVDYIETVTRGEVSNLVGYRLVVTAVQCEFLTSGITWSTSGATSSSVEVENSLDNNPILYSFASNIGTSSAFDFNISIENNTNNPIKISNLIVSPKFYVYNGQSGDDFGIADTRYVDFTSNSNFIYDSTMWAVAKSGNNYVFTSKTGSYIAPHTSLTLISGVYVSGTDSASWSFDVATTTYYADYWFTVGITGLTYSTATTSTNFTTNSLELLTTINNSSLSSGDVSYIAVKNNTIQTVSSLTFNATLENSVSSSNTVNYSCLNYATNATQSNQISISFSGINLLPGESIILCKITITSGANVRFAKTSNGTKNYTLSATLGATTTYTSPYIKRDIASGNVSLINPTSNDVESVTVKLTNFAGNVTLSDVSKINYSAYWTYSNGFVYDGILNGYQLINMLSDYTSYTLKSTIV